MCRTGRNVCSVQVSEGGERPPRTVGAPLLTVLCLLAAGALAWHLLAIPLWDGRYGLFTNGIDTKVYRGGAQAVLDGNPLYDGPVYRVWQFTYAPFAAVVLLPLALVSRSGAVELMTGVNIVCLFVLAVLTLRALGFRRDRRFWLAAIAVSAFGTVLEPVHTTFWNGQINLVLAVLVVGGLTVPRGAWRGVGIGIAAGIKLTPMFFVFYLAVTRQWRAAATAVGTFLATVAIGFAVIPRDSWRFWTHTVHDTSRIGPLEWPPNQSFNGFFVRLGTMGLWQAPSWLWLPVGVVAGGLGVYAAWRAHRAGATMLAITVTGLTGCAVSPFSWCHHWVWVLPLLVIVLVQAVDATRRDRPVTWLWWCAPAAIIAITFVWQAHFVVDGRPVRRFGLFHVWAPGEGAWHTVTALIGSGAYLIVFVATVAVTLWWTRRREPIRFKPNAVATSRTVEDAAAR